MIPAVRSLTGWPLGRLAVLQPSVVIVGAVLLQTWPRLSWPYQEWIDTSQQFHEQLLLAGPIAAAAATYYAGRYAAPRRVASQPWAPRAGRPIALRHLRTLGFAFATSYLVGLLPLLVMTIVRAEAESPYLLTMLTGFAGLAAAIAVGYAVGVLSGTAWLTPLTLVAGFVTMQLAHTYDAFAAVIPVTHVPAGLGRSESVPLTAYRLMFFVLLAATATMIAARALTRTRRLVPPAPQTACLIALIAVGVLTPVLTRPALLVVHSNQAEVCDRVGAVRVCVHEGHRSQLPAVANAAERMFTVAGGPPDWLRDVQDRALSNPTGDAAGVGTTSWVNLYPQESAAHYAADALAGVLSGFHSCSLASGVAADNVEIARQLRLALLGAAGYANTSAAADTHFGNLSAAQLRDWISRNGDQVARCAVPMGRLP